MNLPEPARQPLPLDGRQLEGLQAAMGGLSSDQLQWLSGYAAGLAAARVEPVEPGDTPTAAAEARSVLTILYGSQTGNGEGVARRLEAEARESGFPVRLHSLADYRNSALKREQLVVFVVSTHGEGDPPDDAELFREFLLSDKAPSLEGVHYSVLALGDSSYVNYCQTGREFDNRLAELGATRMAAMIECDVDFDAAARKWSDDVIGQLDERLRPVAAVTQLHAVNAPAGEVYDRARPFAAEVLVNQKITGATSDKDVRHIELSIDGSGIRYEPGDALAVVPHNPPALVDQLTEHFDFDPSANVTIGDETLPLADALRSRVEITANSLGFLRRWAVLVNDAAEREALERLLEATDPSELSGFVDGHQVIDVVRQFPAMPHPQLFVDSLRPLTPRSYSIASSMAANPDEVHLTVAAVRYEAFGSEHWGTASTHLADRVETGDFVDVYVEPNKRFRLPADDSADVIMIGPGTGVAPFRAFVEERIERAASGRNWLFFGDRHFSSDFLYQLEWQRHLRDGHLERMDVAFSRDQADKIYVQDRIAAQSARLFEWIENGASIYVCGDAKRMAPDVEAALVDVLVDNGGYTADDARATLKRLRREGRYQRDVY